MEERWREIVPPLQPGKGYFKLTSCYPQKIILKPNCKHVPADDIVRKAIAKGNYLTQGWFTLATVATEATAATEGESLAELESEESSDLV